jgi:hypothetical protein
MFLGERTPFSLLLLNRGSSDSVNYQDYVVYDKGFLYGFDTYSNLEKSAPYQLAMSLQTLGFGHARSSPLRLSQQFMSSSTTVSSYPSPRFQKVVPAVAVDTSEDNKDVLIERLNDLVQRLSTDHSLEDRVVSRLHKEMDNIEIVMIKADVTQKLDSEQAGKKGGRSVSEGNTSFWGSKTPSRKVSIPKSESPSRTPRKEVERMSTDVAARIAQEAEALATSLSKSIVELQLRREEADVSHIVCSKLVGSRAK